MPASSRRSFVLACGLLPWLPFGAHAGGRPLMLANVYRNGMPLADYWVSEKYDGVRAYWDGQQLWTRHGQRILAPAWFTHDWPAQPLDGELWAGRGRFTAASSAVARDAADDEAWRGLRYMVFDLPGHLGPFDDRLAALNTLLSRQAWPGLHGVAQRRVSDEATLQSMLHETVRAGGEGLMLHRRASHYRGERSDDLLKLKQHLDAEATVVGHVPGRGKYEGRVGALLVQTPQGLRFKLGSGLRDADRASPPAVGSLVTYRYLGLHPDGAPRFASFVRARID